MSDTRQLEILARGADAWNAWRKEGVFPDLREANLDGAKLYRVNLSQSDLSGAILSGAKLMRIAALRTRIQN